MASEPTTFKRPMTLGSKARSFIPMTPRSIKSNHDSRNDFAKQVANQTGRGADGQPPQKKFKSNAAPKGTRFATGYTDRARERMKEQEDAGDDKEQRLRALEKMLKEEQIDKEAFEKLRDELGVGGDVASTHLVKGLDFKLLERVKRGEDVAETPAATTLEEPVSIEEEIDLDTELESALEKDVVATARSKSQDHIVEEPNGNNPSDVAAATATLSRNEILRRLKERRQNPGLTSFAELEPKRHQSDLDHSKFRKLQSVKKSNKHKFTESINGRRREVLVLTGKDGKTKRKTRWLDPEPDASVTEKGEVHAWGSDLPADVLAKQKAVAEQSVTQDDDNDQDEDIFGGVTDYDPLAGIDSDEEEDMTNKKPAASGDANRSKEETAQEGADIRTVKPLKSTAQPRNYFNTNSADTTDESSRDLARDPALLAAFKRAAQLRKQEEAAAEGTTTQEDLATTEAPSQDSKRSKALLKKLQQQSGQDDVDLDLGFGGDARYDEDDEGDSKQKLSEWKGADAVSDDDEHGAKNKGGDTKRKRGGKKKKGDKNSFTDVMNVIEGRKKS